MTAYSFQRRFIEPIRAGVKGGTIRGPRRNHAKPGDALQLYTGMRTKQCRLIATKICLGIAPIRLTFDRPCVISGNQLTPALVIAAPRQLDAFARFDGFKDWADLCAFWLAEHGALMSFAGFHIRWLALPDAVVRAV